MRAMEAATPNDPAVMARVQMYRFRTLEELYDLEDDPGCLNNLAESPEYKEQLGKMRKAMETRMKASGDPVLKAFRNRYNAKIIAKEFDRIYPDHNPVIKKMAWERF